jgi:hypothetical protein
MASHRFALTHFPPWRDDADIMQLDSVIGVTSLVVAVVALWVAWMTLRRTTQHVLRVVRCRSHYEQSIERPSGFHGFEVYFKNLGLAIPEMAITLGFQERNGFGWCSHGLRAVNMLTQQSSATASRIETGTVVEFALRSYEMNEGSVAMLGTLEDVRKQKAVLSVYSAGYQVKRIRLWSWHGWFAGRVYSLIFKVLEWLKMGSFATNQRSWRARIRLPDSSRDLSFSLTNFLQALRRPPNQPFPP